MNLLDILIGLPTKEAVNKIIESGFRSRITYKNGEYYVTSTDFNCARINLHIEDDKVSKAYIG